MKLLPALAWLNSAAGHHALGWLACIATVVGIRTVREPAPPYIDEVYWIGSAYYWHLAAHDRDWSHPDWQLLPARENPPVAKYAFGLALEMTGQRVTTPDLLGTFYLIYRNRPGAWGTGAEFAKREAVARRVTGDVTGPDGEVKLLQLTTAQVTAARRLNAAFAVLAGMAVCAIGIQLGGFATGLVASQLLLWHPAMIQAHAMAMSDAAALAFATAAMLLLLRWLEPPSPRRAGDGRWFAGFAIAQGLCLALACGAKINAILPAIVTGLAALWLLARSRTALVGRRPWPLVAGLVGALVVGAVVFVAINPALHRNLPDGLQALVREHRLTAEVQAGFIGRGFASLAEKATAAGRLLCGHEALGALAAAVALWQAVRLRRSEAGLACAAWFFLSVVLVVAWLPFMRGRYILPILPPAALLVAQAVTDSVAWLAARLRRPAATA